MWLPNRMKGILQYVIIFVVLLEEGIIVTEQYFWECSIFWVANTWNQCNRDIWRWLRMLAFNLQKNLEKASNLREEEWL